MKPTLLTAIEIESQLANLKDWQLDSNKINRKISFDNFIDAFAFMTRIALIAEKMDHHPDWSNSYNKVSISLTTHSSGGITQLDIDLARQIDANS